MATAIRGSTPKTTRTWTGRVTITGNAADLIDSGNAYPQVGWSILDAPPTTMTEQGAATHKSGAYSAAYSVSTMSRVKQTGDQPATVQVTLGPFPLIDPAWMADKHFYWWCALEDATGSTTLLAVQENDPE